MPEPKVYRRQTAYKTAVDEDSRIIFLPVEQIRPNRAQPRKRFDTNTMIRLADSVRRYGVLQPLTVRRAAVDKPDDAPYELIAGERRLRAAKLAGLSQVPCVLAEADDHLSAELAIIENLLREDLNMFEQAKAFGRLIVQFSLTQEQVARKMSMSQSAVANKLRLLKLSPEEQALILENELTERHARSLLRLPEAEMRKKAIHHIAQSHLNVNATEQYVERLISATQPASVTGSEDTFDEETDNSGAKKKLILKDLRIFYNSIDNAVEILRRSGVKAGVERTEDEKKVVVTIYLEPSAVESMQ